jgi:hypothetical protein
VYSLVVNLARHVTIMLFGRSRDMRGPQKCGGTRSRLFGWNEVGRELQSSRDAHRVGRDAKVTVTTPSSVADMEAVVFIVDTTTFPFFAQSLMLL